MLAFLADAVYGKLTPQRTTGMRGADYLFNGATFSASVMLGVGIWDPSVLKLIGDTTGYLILAAFAGFGYSVLALKAKLVELPATVANNRPTPG